MNWLPAWPRTLFGRMLLVLFLGLALAHVLTFALVLAERGMAMRQMMITYLASDVASSVAVLERLPASERAQWLPTLSRRNYRLVLDSQGSALAAPSSLADAAATAVATALAPPRAVRVLGAAPPHAAQRLQLQLVDGTLLAVELDEPGLNISPWAWAALALQLLLLAVLCAWAVRAATRPLQDLADAADALAPATTGLRLAETGPREVVRAAAAFNRMRDRIQAHLQERMQILAAVSHDLQTPITRLRLRADLLDDTALRDKLHADLTEMQGLVEEGIAYARSAHAAREAVRRVDLRALLDSIALDYADAGRPVQLLTAPAASCDTRPQALRRLVCNLVDNALKFAGTADIALAADAEGSWLVQVLDRGPGIPEAALAEVLQPFVRLDDSRNRDTGGTGLGLAIASELAQALGGQLTLAGREGGGLEARVLLPA